MKLSELSGDAKFLFFTTMQAAIKFDDLGKDKKEWTKFCEEVWTTLEMQPDKEKLRAALVSSMMQDMKTLVGG